MSKPLSPLASAILPWIECATPDHPVSIAVLRSLIIHGATDRDIKGAVAELRDAGHRIGSSRGKPPGYYPITSAEDADRTARVYIAQAITMLVRARRNVTPQRWRELMGQDVLEIMRAVEVEA